MPSLFAGDDGGENDEPYRDDPLASPPPGAPLESPAVGTGDAAGQMTPPGAETPPADLPRHGLRRRIYLLLPLLLTLYSLTDTNQNGAPPGGSTRLQTLMTFFPSPSIRPAATGAQRARKP